MNGKRRILNPTIPNGFGFVGNLTQKTILCRVFCAKIS